MIPLTVVLRVSPRRNSKTLQGNSLDMKLTGPIRGHYHSGVGGISNLYFKKLSWFCCELKLKNHRFRGRRWGWGCFQNLPDSDVHPGMRTTAVDLRAAVLNLGCKVEIPRQPLKVQMPRLLDQLHRNLWGGISISQMSLDDINIDIKPSLRTSAFCLLRLCNSTVSLTGVFPPC